jgi:hypothetical protein
MTQLRPLNIMHTQGRKPRTGSVLQIRKPQGVEYLLHSTLLHSSTSAPRPSTLQGTSLPVPILALLPTTPPSTSRSMPLNLPLESQHRFLSPACPGATYKDPHHVNSSAPHDLSLTMWRTSSIWCHSSQVNPCHLAPNLCPQALSLHLPN